MRLEKYREAWHLLTAPEDHETIEIQGVADETVYSDLDTEDLRALLTELKDPAAPGRMKKSAKNKTGKKKTGKTNTEKKTGKKKPARSKPIRLPKSAAPWPIPALKVLKARTGKRILPAPPQE
jgi:hypothetical protein